MDIYEDDLRALTDAALVDQARGKIMMARRARGAGGWKYGLMAAACHAEMLARGKPQLWDAALEAAKGDR